MRHLSNTLILLGLLALLPSAASATQPAYTFPPTRSVISVSNDPLAIPNPAISKKYYLSYDYIRAYEFMDFNGDGLTDVIVAPSFFNNLPRLPIKILLQQSDGSFVDGTSQIVEGAIPTTGFVNDMLIGDFNGDGRPDIFMIDQGLEDKDPLDGAQNILLLSQVNGRYRDASPQISSNVAAFHHNGSVGDINGDGHLDIVTAILGTSVTKAGGVVAWLGDGKGNFTRSTESLPAKARYSTYNQMDAIPDFQSTYGVMLGDLDGDGRLDLITATGGNIRSDETHNIRFYRQQPDHSFVEAGRWQVPAGQPFSNWGIWRPAVGDVNGDGRPDLAIYWETSSQTYAGILRNDGNFKFTDITSQALGGYDLSGSVVSGQYRLLGKLQLTDINHDGLADLVIRSYGGRLEDLVVKGVAYLGSATGAFTPWVPHTGSSALTLVNLMFVTTCTWCDYRTFFVPDRTGNLDLLLVDDQSNARTGTAQSTALITYFFRDTSTHSDENCFFAWAESRYPEFFPGTARTLLHLDYSYRYYPGKVSYLAINNVDAHAYTIIPSITSGLLDLGTKTSWFATARNEKCQ